MAKFIDVDLLKESVLGWNPPLDAEQLNHMIDTIPTADVVEVVRCKDCRNRYEKNWAKCHGRKPDDFCSDGERKEGDQ